MTESTSSIASRQLRLPAVVIALLLVAGLLSVAFASGTFTTLLAVALFAVNVFGAIKYFGDEAKRLRSAHTGNGSVDKKALRKDAMKSQAMPLWLVVTLVLGSIWTAVFIVKVIGFVVGLLFVLAIIAGLAAAAWYGYKVAKKRGMLD